MTIMTVRTREWSVGYHLGRLIAVSDDASYMKGTWCGNLFWVVSPLSNKLREKLEMVGSAQGNSGRIKRISEVCWETIICWFASSL